MIAKLFNVLILLAVCGGIGYGIYHTYVIQPQSATDGATLRDDMQVALQFKSHGITEPYDFIVSALKGDLVFTNAEHDEYSELCEDWQVRHLIIQFILGGVEENQVKASAEKPDL